MVSGRLEVAGPLAERDLYLDLHVVPLDRQGHLVARLVGEEHALEGSVGRRSSVPSMAVITSLAWSPASSAGLPSSTATTP